MNQAFEPACTPIAPPWEAPQVIPAQIRRVNNLIFRKINGCPCRTMYHYIRCSLCQDFFY